MLLGLHGLAGFEPRLAQARNLSTSCHWCCYVAEVARHWIEYGFVMKLMSGMALAAGGCANARG